MSKAEGKLEAEADSRTQHPPTLITESRSSFVKQKGTNRRRDENEAGRQRRGEAAVTQSDE